VDCQFGEREHYIGRGKAADGMRMASGTERGKDGFGFSILATSFYSCIGIWSIGDILWFDDHHRMSGI
jgi:hypothetical protein